MQRRVWLLAAICALGSGGFAVAAPLVASAPSPGLSSASPTYSNGVGGSDAFALNHSQFSYVGPGEADLFKVRLEAIRDEGLRLRAQDGGTLTARDRAMLQEEIDTAFKQHNEYIRTASRSVTAAMRWGTSAAVR